MCKTPTPLGCGRIDFGTIHNTPLGRLSGLRGRWGVGNEALVVLRVVEFYCRRLERHGGKGPAQLRIATMTQQHRQLAIVEISSAAAEITREQAFS
jgi:hypothetical protein